MQSLGWAAENKEATQGSIIARVIFLLEEPCWQRVRPMPSVPSSNTGTFQEPTCVFFFKPYLTPQTTSVFWGWFAKLLSPKVRGYPYHLKQTGKTSIPSFFNVGVTVLLFKVLSDTRTVKSMGHYRNTQEAGGERVGIGKTSPWSQSWWQEHQWKMMLACLKGMGVCFFPKVDRLLLSHWRGNNPEEEGVWTSWREGGCGTPFCISRETPML